MNCPFCGAANDDASDVCFTCGRGMATLTAGAVLVGRYEVRGLVGRGGMGVVYKAYDRELDEVVAIKLLRMDYARSEELSRRFRTEIKLARRVRHTNVCGIHEYGQDGHLRFIVMEYIDGVNLRDLMQAQGPLSPASALDTALQVAEGLKAIHAVGIVHRDLKTANIMRAPDGVVRLMDFGIAKHLDSESTGGATATGHIVGTPEYMSPEQARAEKLDVRSDIYALGIVTYELFVGEVPFRGDTAVATLLKHLNEAADLGPERAGRIPLAARPVVARCLAKQRDERYSSVREFVQALQAAAAETPGPVSETATLRLAGGAAALAVPRPLPETNRLPTPYPTPVPSQLPTPVATAKPYSGPMGVPTVVAPTVAPAATRQAPSRLRWRGPVLALGGVAAALAAVALTSRTPAREGSAQPSDPIAVPDSTVVERPVSPPPVAMATMPRGVEAAVATGGAPRRPAPSPSPSAVSPRTAVAAAPSVAPSAARADPAPAPPVTVVPSAEPPPRAAPPEPGVLKVVVRPWGEVVVDDRSAGSAPVTLRLEPGRHVVWIKHPDYKPLSRNVEVKAGQTVRLEIDMAQEAFRR
ncbi:MAG TPA: protein kinase [Vicinamibacteria bacterium]|nr:protein kinase [Vicinamibacteria bacterium]